MKNGTYYAFALGILSETIKFLNNSVLFTIFERIESCPGFLFQNKERAEVTCNRRVLCEHMLFILKRWRDKIKICFLTTGKFFKHKDEKEKHFTMQTFSLCTLNKPRTQLNIDLSGVFSTLLNLLLIVKALCLGSIFLSAQHKAFQVPHLRVQQVCFVGLRQEVPFVQDCLLCLFIFHQG